MNRINLFLTCHKDQIIEVITHERRLRDDSYCASDIQDYIEYIVKKKQETLTTVLTIHVYINRTNNRLVFQTEKGYKLELKMPEAMKLFRSTNKLMDKRKTEKRVPGLEVVEVVLLECNLVNNHYQKKSEILYTFTPSKSYAYLLLAEPRSLVFLKTCNTEIILTFTDKNSRPLKVEHKFNLTLFINRQK